MNFIRKNSLTAAGIIAILISTLVIVGWLFHIPLLTSVSPNFISMKFNTAICFLFTGIAMVMIGKRQGAYACQGCLLLVLLISVLTLLEYFFTVNIGIDEFFWKEGSGTPYTIYPGRPSALTATSFIFISIVLFNINNKKKFILTWLALTLCLLIAIFSAISYLFGNPELISIPSLTVIALHSAVLFIIICAGIYYTDFYQHTALSFQHRMLAGFLVIAFMLLVVVYLDNKADRWIQRSTADISSNTQTITLADNIMAAITRIESRVQGYLLTQDTALPAQLNQARKDVTDNLAQLTALVASHPYQQPRIDSLSVLLTSRISLLDSLMRLSVTAKPVNQEIRKFILQIPVVMSSIITLLNELKKQENEVLLQQQFEINRDKTKSDRAILFLGFCILAIFVSLVQFIFRNTNARIAAETEARNLATTLEKKVEERTDQLNTVNIQLHRLTEHLQQVQEDERRQLAREVNDEIGQLASAVKMDIDWLALHVTHTDPKVNKRISNASYILQTLIDDVRKLASSLRPVMIDELGLNASIRWLCEQFTKTNGIPCSFTEEMDDAGIPQQTRTELFRICQESLTNVEHHAHASQVNVRLWQTNGEVELAVADNGTGFDADQHSDRLGLIGIKERVLSINGTLRIETAKEQGTTLFVRVPLS